MNPLVTLLTYLIFAKGFRFYVGDEDGAGKSNLDTAVEEDDANPEKEKAEDDTTGDEEGEGDAEAEEDAEEGSVEPVNLMIPKSRYDSAQSRARDAEAKVKKYEQQEIAAQQAAASTKTTAVQEMDTRLAEIDTSIEQARLDGDADTIVKLSQEARNIEREQFTIIAREEAKHAGSAAQENVKLDTLIENLETTYDILNPDSDNFDKEVISEVLELQGAFVARGDTPSVAMLKAVGYVLPEERVKDEVGAKRTTNVSKNLDAAKRTPASTTDVGIDSAAAGISDDKPDVAGMTDEEFDALPEATLKRLRGDAG